MIIHFNFDTFELTELKILSNYRVVMLKNPAFAGHNGFAIREWLFEMGTFLRSHS